MHIEPLSPATLDQAINLRDKVFPGLSKLDRETFSASLFKEQYQQWFLESTITQLNYWVAIDDESKKVIGTTGLYCETEDENEAYWLGWFCVEPEFRGQGIGAKLLDFSINTAKAAGKKYLRLYSWTNPDSATAQILYKKRGFRAIGEEEIPGSRFKIIYLELDLCRSS